MTQRTKDLLAQLEQELETLPEAEQEAYVGALLEDLRHRKQEGDTEDGEPYASFHVLKNAQFSGEEDESTTYERSLYGLDEDDE